MTCPAESSWVSEPGSGGLGWLARESSSAPRALGGSEAPFTSRTLTVRALRASPARARGPQSTWCWTCPLGNSNKVQSFPARGHRPYLGRRVLQSPVFRSPALVTPWAELAPSAEGHRPHAPCAQPTLGTAGAQDKRADQTETPRPAVRVLSFPPGLGTWGRGPEEPGSKCEVGDRRAGGGGGAGSDRKRAERRRGDAAGHTCRTGDAVTSKPGWQWLWERKVKGRAGAD